MPVTTYNHTFTNLPTLMFYASIFSALDKATKTTSRAISKAIDEIYIKKGIQFNIATSDFDKDTSNDLIREISNHLNGISTYKIYRHREERERFPTVFLMHSPDELYSVNSYIALIKTNFSMPVRFLIYCTKLTGKNYRYILKPDYPLDRRYWIDYSDNYYVIENHRNLTILSYFVRPQTKKFQNEDNFVLSLEIAATFDKINKKWIGGVEKLETKYKSKILEGLKVLVFLNHGTQYDYYKDKNTRKTSGVLVDIFDIVSQRAKFTPYYELVIHNNYRQQGFSDDLMPTIYFSSFYSLKGSDQSFTKTSHLTATYTEDNFRLIITPPESLSSYEKIMKPFDTTTWILLIITFITVFCVIFYINRKPKWLQNTVYGDNVRSPIYNTISIIFGIAQYKLPKRNFARFILVMFIMFCLIFRTAYVGVLFEILALDIQNQPPPKTLLDLVEKNFTFCRIKSNAFNESNSIDYYRKQYLMVSEINEIIRQTSSGKIYHQNTREFIPSEFKKFYLQNYKNASAKLAFYADDETLSELNSLCQCSNLLLEEKLLTQQLGLAIEKDSFLFNLIDDTIQKILSAGIPQHSAEYHKWVLYKNFKVEDESNIRPYSLDDVSFAFILFFITCGIATFCFLCEVSWVSFKIHGKEFLGFVLFFVLLYKRLQVIY